MSSILGKIPKFTLKLPSALAKAGRTMSECPLELSFSLCDDNSARRKTEEEIPLQVKLPPESEKSDLFQNLEISEKADEEKSEKQDNMEVTCSVTVDGQEKQEFSFTLYEFDTCDKSNKQDVEKVVVRSICEALGKTLKLPPSGSRTIKVKLAISPDSSKEGDTKDLQNDILDWPMEPPKPVSAPSKLNDCCSAQSANTTSTYLPSSLSEKPPKYSSPSITRSPQTVRISSPNVRAMPSPKLRPAARLKKHDLKTSLRERIVMQMSNAADNRHVVNDNLSKEYTEDQVHHHPSAKHPPNSRDHVPECRDRRNHYLDLAGVESPKHNLSQRKINQDPPGSPRLDPNYMCSYHNIDHIHGSPKSCPCQKSHRNHNNHMSSPFRKPSVSCHPKLNINVEGSPRMYRTKINPDLVDSPRMYRTKIHPDNLEDSPRMYRAKINSDPVEDSPRMYRTKTNSDPADSSPRVYRTKINSDPVEGSPRLYRNKIHPELPEDSPRVYRTKINPNPEDDLLNLNFDLCDLVPDAKFDWEKPQHRRSKSYDLYENDFTSPGGLYSPKLKPRNNQNWTSILENQKFSNLPSSPGHHYRHRHRDREKQRAMQQVASWIAREHSSNSKTEATKQFVRNSVAQSPSHRPITERHEHHHLHEHVHHHYHHFVEF